LGSSSKNNLILCGFQGIGKTLFGRELAKELSWAFLDTDCLLEKEHKMAVSMLYQKVGEKKFRLLEEEVVASLVNISHTVVSLGGGTPLSEKNRFLLRKIGCVIYLSCSEEELLSSLMQREPFPSYIDCSHPEESIRQLFQHRDPIYREFSDEQK
jgi:shikimate kinase